MRQELFVMPEGAQYLDGHIIVKVQSSYRAYCKPTNISLPEWDEIKNVLDIQSVSKVFPHKSPPTHRLANGHNPIDLSLVYTLTYERDISMSSAVNQLLALGIFEYAEPWYTQELFYQPNDSWADTTGGVDYLWYLKKLKAREAWSVHRDDSTVVVGVTDTGISFNHPDLQENLYFNVDDPLDGVDNDADGYVDNFRGWDMSGAALGGFGDNNPSYLDPHGVAVAGAFGAVADNEIGTAGTGFNCRFLPVKVVTDQYPSSVTHGYQGIVYAADQGVDIINCSWGGSANSAFGEDVVNYAINNKGVAVLAAAGNSGDDRRFYPAAYPNVLAVTGTDWSDEKYDNATYNYSVDVSSPGVSLRVPTEDDLYVPVVGTSFASPLVAGAVALVKGYFPDYTGFQAAERVRVTTDGHYEQNDAVFFDRLGTGRVNMYRALTDPLKPSIRQRSHQIVDSDGDGLFVIGDTLLVSAEYINYLDPSNNLEIEVSTPDQEVFIAILDGKRNMGVVGENEIFDNQDIPFKIWIKLGTPTDYKVNLKFTYTDPVTAYTDFEYVEFVVNPTYTNIDVGDFHTTVNSVGQWGFNDYPYRTQGLGASLGGQENVLIEGGFLVGNGQDYLLDNVRDPDYPADDFRVVEKVLVQDPYRADFEVSSIFDDQASMNPKGLSIAQHSFAYEDDPDNKYVIFQYILQNMGADSLNDMYAGLFADWNIDGYAQNACNYANSRMVYAYNTVSNLHKTHYGMGLLSPEAFNAYAVATPSSFEFTDSMKYIALSNQPTPETASLGVDGGKNIAHFLSAGPFDLPPLGVRVLAFVVMAGADSSSLVETHNQAKMRYFCNILGAGPIGGFSYVDTLIGDKEVVQFVDNNLGTTSWEWDFGDGIGSSTEKNPVYEYMEGGEYEVRFTAVSAACNFTMSKWITVEERITTAIEDERIPDLRVYPNPNEGVFQVELEDAHRGDMWIRVCDMMGRVVYVQRYSKLQDRFVEEIRLDGISDGLYEVVIEVGDVKSSGKIWVR